MNAPSVHRCLTYVAHVRVRLDLLGLPRPVQPRRGEIVNDYLARRTVAEAANRYRPLVAAYRAERRRTSLRLQEKGRP